MEISRRLGKIVFNMEEYNYDIMILTFIKMQFLPIKCDYDICSYKVIFQGTSPFFNETPFGEEPMVYSLDSLYRLYNVQ